ncbi:DUF3438 family protein [Vibrio fluvialis]|uniref:DUF3438 family protein n=1 Tax=Vibrio fluvialis TaxID=676 RepID=UPI00192A91B6|nr:DUF3438 family protein [Vibrio fluvialis]MBL4262821.1 DUF3438 family protein [Vibrio fluvialis]
MKHLIVLFLMSFLWSGLAVSAERVSWEQNGEINLVLNTNLERKVIFPELVMFYKKDHFAKLFKSSFIDSSFYITAKVGFEERLLFKGVTSNRIYTLNAVVSDSGAVGVNDDLVIHLPSESPIINTQSQNGTPWKTGKANNAVDLVQYAAQNLYSDIVEPLQGVKKVSVDRAALPYFYRLGALSATPLAGWFSDGLYVTAVKLNNVTANALHFEPCRVRGDFMFVSEQFSGSEIQPQGQRNDYTVAYFVSSLPFAKAAAKRLTKCQ